MRINDRIVSLPELQFSRQVRLQLIAPIQC